MWPARDVPRDRVRRQANSLDGAVAQRVAKAAARERETADQSRRGDSFSEFERDPERLADTWAAKHVEWRRVRDSTAAAGLARTRRDRGSRARTGLGSTKIRVQVLAPPAERGMVGERRYGVRPFLYTVPVISCNGRR